MQYWGQRWLHLCNLCKPGIRLRQQSPPDPEHQDHLPLICNHLISNKILDQDEYRRICYGLLGDIPLVQQRHVSPKCIFLTKMYIPHQNVYYSPKCIFLYLLWRVWRWHILWLIMRHHLSPELSPHPRIFDKISMNLMPTENVFL